MKKIILITSSFPYEGGEQFLETEIQYYTNVDLTIMPKKKSLSLRNVPHGVTIDNYLINNLSKKSKCYYLFSSMARALFYKELFLEKVFTYKKLKIFLASIYSYRMYYELFDMYIKKQNHTNEILFYSYWNDSATYALQSLKEKYNFQLVSRIHRGDLYKERRPFGYMPLKKHFTENIDTVYTITQSANVYLEDVYGFKKEILKLSRLGVEDRNIVTKNSPQNCLNIVSCSFLVEVKQIDKMIKSLKIIANEMQDIDFKWTHIGDGILYNQIAIQAQEELDNLSNVNYSFVGNYKNEKVYEFYLKNEVDVFVNVSESEGVPVSIMEAMSCHIPIVAPDVGGVKDMVVEGCNGCLLSKDCTLEEIVTSLKNIDFFKDKKTRENSYRIFQEKYNAEKNYTEFVNNLAHGFC